MGNCIALCKINKSSCAKKEHRVVQVVKMDGKILEFKTPIIVKDLLANFSGLGVFISKRVSLPLPPTYELKRGKTYHLLPSENSATVETEQTGGVKRIKVVVTKKQLKELLTKQVSVEDVLTGLGRRTCSSVDSLPPTCNWKPKLESIAEGSE